MQVAKNSDNDSISLYLLQNTINGTKMKKIEQDGKRLNKMEKDSKKMEQDGTRWNKMEKNVALTC